MKKITYLLTALFLIAFSWQGTAQVGGDDCATAEIITPGAFVGTTITDGTGGASQGDAADAKWFSYTPVADGTIDVSACLGGSDTRLWIWDGTCGALGAVADNDDVCDLGTGDAWASELTGVPVTGGTEYFIEWDDRWEDGVAFDWSLTYTPPPTCAEPNTLAASSIVPGTGSDGTVTVSWVDGGTSGNFEYEVVDITGGGTPTGVGIATSALFVDLTGLTLGSQYQLLVRADCGLDGFSTWASVFWTMSPPPDCVDTPITPTDGEIDVAFGVTPLTWTEAAGGTAPTDYDIWFGTTSGSLNYLGTLAAPLSAINITNTLPSLTYYWQAIPTNNGDPATGCAEYSFITKDLPAVPVGVDCSATGNDNTNVFTEEFDAQGLWTGNIGTANGEWHFGQTGATGSGNTGPNVAHSGGAYMYYEASGSTTARASAVTPVDLTGSTGGAELSFFMHAYGVGMGTLEVGVSTAGAAGPFTNVFTWSGGAHPDGDAAWIPVGVNLDAYINQSIHIEVAHTGTGDFTGDMSIDLFNVETCLTLSCDLPTNLAVTNMDATDVDISWDPVGTETDGFDWEIQPEGNVQGDPAVNSGSTATGVTSVVDVAGPFTQGALYTLFVRSKCGLAGDSGYSSFVFTIPALAGGDDCASAVAISPGTFLGTTINDINPGTNNGDAVWFSYTATGDGTIDVSSCIDTNDTRLFIYDGTCGTLNQLGTSDDACGLASEVLATPVLNGTEYFIQWDDRWSIGPFDWELTFTPAPTCFEPVNITATNLSVTNADLSWDQEPGATDGYRWEIQDVGVAQGDLGVIDSGYNSGGPTDTSVTSSGAFVAGNSYTLYVNSVCTNGVDESTYASIDFTVPLFNGNCGAFSSSPGTDIINTNPPTVDVITGTGTVGDVLTGLRVYVGITHTFIGDMTITLTSPSGTSVDIFNGCGSEANIDIEFDDAAGAGISCGVPGIYMPDNPLSAFDGEFFEGNWTLTVTDGAGGDDGTLDQWCLIPAFDTVTVAGACTSGTIWTWDGAAWDNLGSPGPNDFAVIDGLYQTVGEGNLDVCGLWITTNGTLVVGNGSFARTGDQNNIVIGGLLVTTDGSFIQTGTDARTVRTSGSGINIIKNTTTLDDVHFTIMGSPMDGETREDVYASAANVRFHETNNFVPFANGLPDADNWADDNGDNWLEHTGPLTPGAGYLVKPQLDGGGAPAAFQSDYTLGNLNSGPISFTPILIGGDPNVSPNILANPYPSSFDITAFLTDNPDAGSALYFWEHIAAPDPIFPGYQLVANYTMDDVSNSNGTIANASASGGTPPTAYVPSGQGFGIKPTAATQITFTNSMRVGTTNTGYRNSTTILDELHLKVSNDAYGLKGHTAIGFTDINTNELERMDVKRLPTSISIYSVVEDMSLGIQMRSVFNDTHIIPLGFHTFVEENQTYTISINEFEGELITNATVFLKDNLLNTVTNLSETDYNFTANVGYQTDRFVLVFEQTVLGNEEVSLDAVSVYPNPAANMLTINSPLARVNTVVINDISGRQVAFYNFTDQNSYQMDVTNLESAVYFVEINTDNGSVTKRIIKE